MGNADRLRAHGDNPLRDGRGGSAGGDSGPPVTPAGAASCSTASGRELKHAFKSLGEVVRRLRHPPPSGFFRYVRAEDRDRRTEDEEGKAAEEAVTIFPLPFLPGRGLGVRAAVRAVGLYPHPIVYHRENDGKEDSRAMLVEPSPLPPATLPTSPYTDLDGVVVPSAGGADVTISTRSARLTSAKSPRPIEACSARWARLHKRTE